jgi:hypothetical protein
MRRFVVISNYVFTYLSFRISLQENLRLAKMKVENDVRKRSFIFVLLNEAMTKVHIQYFDFFFR